MMKISPDSIVLLSANLNLVFCQFETENNPASNRTIFTLQLLALDRGSVKEMTLEVELDQYKDCQQF